MWHILFAELQRQSIYPLVQGVTSITWIDASGKLNCSHRFFPKVEVAFALAPQKGKAYIYIKSPALLKEEISTSSQNFLRAKFLINVPSGYLFPCIYRANACLQFRDLRCNWKWRLEYQVLVIVSPSLCPAHMHQALSLLFQTQLLQQWKNSCIRRADLGTPLTRFLIGHGISFKEQKSESKVRSNMTFPPPPLHCPNLHAVKHLMHFFLWAFGCAVLSSK